MSMAILTDVTKCIGCNECVIACKNLYNLDTDVPRKWHKDDGLSSKNWTSILIKEENHYIRKQCRHCLEPACESVCPVGALHQTPEGAVVYDSHKCLGCRYCMMACPYGIPRYEWDSAVPYVRKCIMCTDRIKKGQQPACTEACPADATIFGDRDKLLDISDIDLDFLSYNSKPSTKPLPTTTEVAMKSVPYAFVGMGGIMYGLNWIIRRRNALTDGNEGEKE